MIFFYAWFDSSVALWLSVVDRDLWFIFLGCYNFLSFHHIWYTLFYLLSGIFILFWNNIFLLIYVICGGNPSLSLFFKKFQEQFNPRNDSTMSPSISYLSGWVNENTVRLGGAIRRACIHISFFPFPMEWDYSSYRGFSRRHYCSRNLQSPTRQPTPFRVNCTRQDLNMSINFNETLICQQVVIGFFIGRGISMNRICQEILHKHSPNHLIL